MPRPRVLVIHTGGTLGMPEARPDQVLQPSEVREQLASPLKFLERIADIELDVLVNLDSSNIQPDHWKKLARRLDESRETVDGIVVIHGTDTLAWTSTALSFFMAGPTLPIVFTGSQRPLSAMRSDARRNLLNAVEVASRGPAGIHVVFGDQILPGSAVTKDSIFRFDAFRAPNAPTLGRIGLDITWRQDSRRRRKYWLDTRLNTNVTLLTLFPGLSPEIGMAALESGTGALVIEAFGSGNIPLGASDWSPVLERAKELRIPVVIGSQCQHGRVDPDLYEGARRARELGAIFALGMTREARVVKSMVLVGRKTVYTKFRREFERDWCGETGEVGVAG